MLWGYEEIGTLHMAGGNGKQWAAAENNMAIPQKGKHKIVHDPAMPFLWMYPKELKANTWTGIRTTMFRATFCITVKRWKQPKSPGRGMDKQNVVYTYIAILA